MLNFSEFKTEGRKRAKDKAAVCTDTIMKRWARLLIYDIIIRSGGFWLYDEYTFDAVADTGEYAFPSRFMKPIIFWDTDNEKKLKKVGPEDDWNDIDRSNTGTPDYYKYIFLRDVQAQPTAASKVTLVSSSASDTTSYKVQLRGLDGNGVEISEPSPVVITGETGVESTEEYTALFALGKNQASNGIITATSNSGAVTLVRLGKDEIRREHQWFRLMDTPASDYAYRMNFLRKPHLCVEDYDKFDVPEAIEGAVLLGLEYMVKKYFYDKTQESVFKEYIEQIQRATHFLSHTFDDRYIHKNLNDPSMDGGNTQYKPPFGYMSQVAE